MDRTNKNSIRDLAGQSWDALDEIFNQSPIGIIFHDKEGIVVNANNSALEIMAIPKLEDILGLSLFDNPFYPEKKEELIDKGVIRFQASLDLAMIKNFGFYYPTKKGILFLDYTVSVTDSGFLVQIQDITEHKLADEALMESEEKFSKVFHANPGAIAILEPEGPILEVNDEFINLTGYRRDETIGHISAVKNLVTAVLRKKLMKEIHDKREIQKLEVEIRTKSGEKRVVINTIETIKIEGQKRLISTFFDITDLKKVEEALKESETRYRTLYENSFDAILLTKLDGSILTANLATQKMFGMTEEEIVKVGREGLIVSDGKLEQALKEREDEGIVNAELTAKRKDGSTFLIELTSSLFTDADGIVKTSMVIRDINERKKAEDALKNSEEKYRSIVETANEGIMLADTSGKITFVNAKMAEMLGYKIEELLGIEGASLVDASEFEKARGKIKKRKKGIKDEYEIKFHRKDGGILWVHVNGAPLYDQDGEHIGNLAMYTDVNERKKVEEALWQSQEDMGRAQKVGQIGSWRLDVRHNVLTWSDENYCIFGVPKGTPMTYEAFLGIVHPDDRQYVDTRWKAGLAGEPYDIEHRIVVGEQVNWVREKAYLEFDDEGIVLGGFGITQDITDRKKLEEKLRKYRDNLEDTVEERTVEIEEAYNLVKENEFKLKDAIKELERSNKELQSFAYITSHDLQEPLRTMGSYAGLLKHRYRGQLDSDADDFLDFMTSGASRLQEMIKGLLEYSRVGTRGGVFKDFNAEEALNTALTNLKSSIDECHVEVLYDLLPVIHGDESQISRVFQNLIGNALKFRKKDIQPKVHIKAQKEGNEYIFSVQDNGIGIEPQYIDRIFEVFKRLHAIGEYQGTGIGLAIVKRIIERHHGRIWVESEFGVGSTFYFTIPVEPVEN